MHGFHVWHMLACATHATKTIGSWIHGGHVHNNHYFLLHSMQSSKATSCAYDLVAGETGA